MIGELEIRKSATKTAYDMAMQSYRTGLCAASIRNGLDTLGIRAGKIQYHSSSFQFEME